MDGDTMTSALMVVFVLGAAMVASSFGLGDPLTSGESAITFNVSNPHPYSFNFTPVVLSLNFSRGEAINNSIRVRDSSGQWLPSQVSNAEFYSESEYIKSCMLIFLANLPPRSNSSFTVTYSTHPVYINMSFPRAALNVVGDGFNSDVFVSNEHYNLVIGANSTVGIKRAAHNKSDSELSWMNNSLVGPAILANGILNAPRDFSRWNVVVKYAGPVAAEVEVSGWVESVRVVTQLKFYAKNPTVYAHVEVENFGTKVNWFYPIYALLNTTGMKAVISREGGKIPLSTLGDFLALPSQNWTAFEFEGGYLLAYSLSPMNKTLGEIISLTNGCLVLASVGNVTDVGEPSSRVSYDVSITFLSGYDERELDAVSALLTSPLKVAIQRRELIIDLESPSEGWALDKLRVKARIKALSDIRSLNLSISINPNIARVVAGNEVAGPFLLTRDQDLVYEWQVQFFAVGDYSMMLTCKTESSVVVRETKIRISSPAIFSRNRFKIQIFDSERRTNVGLVNISLYTVDEGKLVASVLSNSTSYAEVQIDSGKYRVKAYKGERLIASETLVLSSPATLYNISSWAYTIKVIARPTWSRPLVAVFSNTTKGLQLLAYKITDETGVATLRGIFNGSYVLKAYAWQTEAKSTVIHVVRSGQEFYVDIPLSIIKITVLSESGTPLENATVSLYDERQGLLESARTDVAGVATFRGVPMANYTFIVRWFGVRVFSGRLDVKSALVNYQARAKVFELKVRFTDPLGNPLSEGAVELAREGGLTQGPLKLALSRDGILWALLPAGNYTLSFRGGLFSKELKMSLFNLLDTAVTCDLSISIPVALALTGACWVSTVFMWQAKTRRVSLEEMKIKDMIAKLDELYQQGDVDDAMYSRIREEYVTKLRRVRG